jgi:GTP-binding protein HflX
MKHSKAPVSTSIMPKTLLIGVEAPYNKIRNFESYYEEFENLARSNNITEYDIVTVKLREINPSYFVGTGKLDEIKDYCVNNKIKQVIISETLSAQQQRNLSDYIYCNVFDRTQLILDIFEKNAHSAEGKIQVEIAMLRHKKTRLAGKGIDMSQQTGISGAIAGSGETAKEKETRVLDEKITTLRRKLVHLEKIRDTQRKTRFKNNVPHICLIGYTNTGKSTLLNILTKSHVLAEDKLFATLDTATKELYVDGEKKGIISDSVGFIQNLPHNLIEAFKSTLEELQYADLLLQVVDISDPNWEFHIKVVKEILDELEVKKDMLYVFNKIDKISGKKSSSKSETCDNTCAECECDIEDCICEQEFWEKECTESECENECDEATAEQYDNKQECDQDLDKTSEIAVKKDKNPTFTLEQTLEQIKKYGPNVIISAKSKTGIKPLLDYLKAWKKKN